MQDPNSCSGHHSELTWPLKDTMPIGSGVSTVGPRQREADQTVVAPTLVYLKEIQQLEYSWQFYVSNFFLSLAIMCY